MLTFEQIQDQIISVKEEQFKDQIIKSLKGFIMMKEAGLNSNSNVLLIRLALGDKSVDSVDITLHESMVSAQKAADEDKDLPMGRFFNCLGVKLLSDGQEWEVIPGTDGIAEVRSFYMSSLKRGMAEVVINGSRINSVEDIYRIM